ncbi:restriction endonuclease subunit S [Methylophaga sp.]|uniref:restriction endonuclease subunit S n=1 Tax=Methylophaga sp. TaxID=2024840 RepID=UPI003A919A40
MDALAAMPKYDSYKNSGTDWLIEIPEQWEMKKVFYLFTAKKGGDAARLTKEYCGANEGDFPVYSGQTENDGVMGKINHYEFDYSANGCLFSTTVGAKAMTVKYLKSKFSLSQNCMIIVPRIASGINLKYFYYAFQPMFQFYRNQIPDHMQASFRMEDLYQYRTLFPSIDEQTAITNFLDKKIAQTDEAIAIKEKQIILLKERKQIIIQKAVTEGLNHNVMMKDSGDEWIGYIPEHWTVKKAKYLFDEADERSVTGEEELLSVSHMTGVTPRSEKNVSMFMAEDYSGSKLCQKNDLVMNIMWAWMGALGVSDRIGIVSPSYGIYRQKRENTFNPIYLEYLLKTTKYIEYYNKVSTGLHSSRLRFYGHMFFAMKIGFPDYEEQNSIVRYLEEQTSRIDQAVAVQDSQIEKLKEYKTTLINNAVTGKIKLA